MTRTIGLVAEIPANRELRITLPPDCPVGPAKIVVLVSTAAPTPTLADLANSEYFGMWSTRADITASSDFAQDLRAQSWKRSA